MIEVRLLGTPEVTMNGEVLHFESRKALALLAYLLLNQGDHSREQLTALLWPESNDKNGRNSLRYTLSIIRKVLGKTTLSTTRRTVAISNSAEIRCDVQTFETAITTEDYAATISLYRGNFMDGFHLSQCAEFDTWQQTMLQTLSVQANAAFEQVIAAATLAENWVGLQDAAQKLHALDPLNETAIRALMEGHAANGNYTLALQQFERAVTDLYETLGVDPEPATQALYERILNLRASAPDDALALLIPNGVPRTPFVGRELEQTTLRDWITNGERLVTILATGGMGKTRLAFVVAQQLYAVMPDGVAFVSLVGANSAENVVAAITAALQITRIDGATPRQLLTKHLRTRNLLLVLDNFEHLIAPKRPLDLVRELLQVAPGLHLLVTSRERLRLRDERLFILDGMQLESAERLFAERAQRHDDAHAAGTIRRLCQLVGCQPLALELAAAQTVNFALNDIETELLSGVAKLTSDWHDIPERHRSIRAVFDQSWRQLSSDLQTALSKLSVFRGGMTMPAMRAVAAITPEQVRRLINYALVKRDGNRYALHELLRQYAAEKLTATHETQSQHAAYYAGLLAKYSPEQLQPESRNLLATWQWLQTQPSGSLLAQVVPELWSFYRATFRYAEATEMLHAVLTMEWHDEQAPLRHAEWTAMLGEAYFRMGRGDDALIHFYHALELLGHRTGGSIDRQLFWTSGRTLLIWLGLGAFVRPRLSPPALRLRASVLTFIGIIYARLNPDKQMQLAGLRMINDAHYVDHPPTNAMAHGWMMLIYRTLRFHQLADRTDDKMLALAKQCESSFLYPLLLAMSAEGRAGRQSSAVVIARTEHALTVSEQHGNTEFTTLLYLMLYTLYRRAGRFTAAQAIAQRLTRLAETTGNPYHLGLAYAIEAGHWIMVDEVEKARKVIGRWQRLPPSEYHVQIAAILIVDAIYAARYGSFEEAAQLAERAIDEKAKIVSITSTSDVAFIYLLSIVLRKWQAVRQTGSADVRHWHQVVQRGLRIHKQLASIYFICKPGYLWAHGAYLHLRGRHRQARKAWQRGLQLARQMELPYEEMLLRQLLDDPATALLQPPSPADALST